MTETERAVRAVLAVCGRAVVRMGGESMLPTLRAPMTLELERLDGEPRCSDVIVFSDARALVAHRVVGKTKLHLLTCGDAQPHHIERVARADVIGRVRGILNERGERAIDLRNGVAALRARAIVWTRLLRAPAARARRAKAATGSRAVRAALLHEFASAAVRGHDELARDLLAAHRDEIFEHAQVHRCFAFAAAYGDPAAADRWQPVAARHRAALAVQATRLRATTLDVRDRLHAAGIAVAALKGAARAASPDATALHPSSDVDLLVPRALARAAVDTLCAAGYRPTGNRSGYERHHHEVPLRSPDGVIVELHTSLVSGGVRQANTDWRSLHDRFLFVRGERGAIRVLDDTASVYHLLLHSLDDFHLRDAIVAAQLLAAKPAIAGSVLEWIRASGPSTRLAGLLSIACDLAGIGLPIRPLARAFARWTLHKSSLPEAMRRYSRGAEAALIALSGEWSAAAAVLCSGVRDTPTLRRSLPRKIAHVAAQLAIAPLVAGYALCVMTPEASSVARIARTSRSARSSSIP
ncbi:MAG: nucleotidyltransferase family protein [Burkholderiales bacterium]